MLVVDPDSLNLSCAGIDQAKTTEAYNVGFMLDNPNFPPFLNVVLVNRIHISIPLVLALIVCKLWEKFPHEFFLKTYDLRLINWGKFSNHGTNA